jgi:hypothetical protein
VAEQIVRPRLAQEVDELAQGLLRVLDEVLVPEQREPVVAEFQAAAEDLLVRAVPVPDGVGDLVVELADQRVHDRSRVPDDADEHRIREDGRHLGDVPGVEGRLLAPPLLPLVLGVPLEHAREELAEAGVDLLLLPAEPLEPAAPARPVRDLLDRGEPAHEAGLFADRDVRMGIQDQPEEGAARTHAADDEDR